MTKEEREVMRMALEALKNAYWPTKLDLMPAQNLKECGEAITAIKEALAQEQEPQIAFNAEVVGYVAPQRTWVGLTKEEKTQVAWACGAMSADWLEFADAIEAKLKEKQ